jgi:hypothetical protein
MGERISGKKGARLVFAFVGGMRLSDRGIEAAFWLHLESPKGRLYSSVRYTALARDKVEKDGHPYLTIRIFQINRRFEIRVGHFEPLFSELRSYIVAG